MTATNLTASISNTVYPVLNTTYKLDDKVDERSTTQITIFDANASYSFQFGQPVSVTDTLEGTRYTGFVSKAKAIKYPANAALAWQLDCVDNEFLAGKKTTSRTITNQYAGIAAASMVNDCLSADGITANYALRDDNTQADFAQGTLSGTIATTNLGGDLELAPAGNQVTITENTTSVFNSGTLTNVTASSNSLAPTAISAIKLVAVQTGQGITNSYTYVKIWSGSLALSGTKYFFYNVWVDPTSPEIKCACDIVFTDGSTLRDNFNTSTGNENSQNRLSPHPNTDLAGYADQGYWYPRTFDLTSFAGKTISYVTVVSEGDKSGTYTAWFYNILLLNNDFSLNTAFFSGSLNVNPPQQMQNTGYSSTKASVATVYDCANAQRVSSSYNISSVGLLKNTFVSWIASLPTNTSFVLRYSINGGNSYVTCTNNAPLPNVLAGLSLAGKSIQFLMQFTQSKGASPESKPVLTSLKSIINPSYTASKSDVTISATTNSEWNTGTTFTNTQAPSNILQLIQSIRKFDKNTTNNEIANMTLFGGGATGPFTTTTCNHYVQARQFRIFTFQSTEARSRLDFAGNYQDFILEFDVSVDNGGMSVGCCYRTTNWVNYNNRHAYSLEIRATLPNAGITFGRGTNSGGGSDGTFTTIATASAVINSQTMHRIKFVVSGNTHQMFVDDIMYINATDSTYTAAGQVALRVVDFTTTDGYIATFDNVGITNTLTGQWKSASTSLTAAGTYGGSVVSWDDVSSDPASSTILVESTVNGGSSWQTVTNGGSIGNLTAGQSLSGINCQLRATLTTPTATYAPQIQGLVARILGGFSSTGTRIAPFLSLSNALIAGSTDVNWTVTTPSNTSITVATSLDGTTYTNVSNGGAIAGITTQPSPTLDTFSSNSSPNYTSTNRTGGATGNWFWDSLNSRLTVSGGTNAQLVFNTISCKDVDMILDLDQADCTGLIWRRTDASNFYELDIFDASSNAGSTNVMRLYKVVANAKTQLGSDGAITFTRGTKYRVRVIMVGTTITISFDGVTIISQTDSSLAGPGNIGISEVSGAGRFYNFRVQPQGDNLSGKIVYSKVTLTSTDPTATPQLTDLTVAALHPNIGLGTLIPSVTYDNTYVSDNLHDLAKKSDYTTYFDQNLNFIFAPRVAQPAPWVLQSSDQQLLLDGPLTVEYSGDLYRNRMTLKGVIGTATDSMTKVGDGTTRSWALGAGVLVSPPTIYVNGNLQTIGLKGIDTGKDFYWSPDSNVVEQDTANIILQQTDNISFQNYTYQFTTTLSVDNTNLANTITQKQFACIMGRTAASRTVLSQASSAHTVSGDAGDVDVSNCRRIAIDINITAVSGTTPTIRFFVDRKGVDGIYYNIWSSSTISTTGPVSTTIGAFAAINQSFGATVKLRWTITGTTPSFTFSDSIMGQMDVQSANFGVVEVVEDVSNQSLSVAAAIAYAIVLLTRYGTIGRTITFKTRRRNPSLGIGQYLPVFIPEHAINDASMLVTAIETNQNIAYDSGTPSQIYYQSVTISENANIGSVWKLLASTLK